MLGGGGGGGLGSGWGLRLLVTKPSSCWRCEQGVFRHLAYRVLHGLQPVREHGPCFCFVHVVFVVSGGKLKCVL